jgi:hypothetical protein
MFPKGKVFFLVFLVLILPAIGNSQQEYSRVEITTSKGCKYVEYTRPDRVELRKNAKVTWDGGCSGGYIAGKGTLTITDNEGGKAVIEAFYENGLEEGQGKSEIQNPLITTKFNGMYSRGFRVNGEFEWIKASGQRTYYKGDFSNGRFEGYGLLKFENDNLYEGQFKSGKINGTGKMVFANGDVYSGEFRDGVPFGQGIIKWKNGTTHEGQFVNAPEGKGRRVFSDGGVLEANFVKGYAEGVGTYKFPNGDLYDGTFVKGSRTGTGKYQWASGNTYYGEFLDGKFAGRGKYVMTNGDVYEREMKDGKVDGPGTYTKPNGDKWYQEFRDGVKVSETPSISNSRSSQPPAQTQGPDLARRQRGIDHMSCQAYAKNAIAGQGISTLGTGASAAMQAILQGTLINMNQQEAYDVCMKNLGW